MAAGGFAAVIAASGLVFATAASACACGAFLLPEDERVNVSTETAIVSFDGVEERILLTMDVDAESEDAALLIPTPSPASVEVSRTGMFTELAGFTAPRLEQVDLWWPEWMVSTDLSNTGPIVEDPIPEPIAVEGIDATIIDASDADELEDWLDKNGYVLRDEIAAALMPYIQQGWHFALIRLQADSLSGRMQPLDIRFETNQVVYPMRLSVAGGALAVKTYLFADHRMERTDSMGGTLAWAGPVDQTDFSHQTLVDLARERSFLTVWEQQFSDPRNQIDSDMVFAASSDDRTHYPVHTEVVRHEILGTPAGPTLIFAGLVLIGGTVVVVSRIRRRRA